MNLPEHNRESAITTLKRIRSKAIDTERLLLQDGMTAKDVITRADELAGQAHVLALSVFSAQREHAEL